MVLFPKTSNIKYTQTISKMSFNTYREYVRYCDSHFRELVTFDEKHVLHNSPSNINQIREKETFRFFATPPHQPSSSLHFPNHPTSVPLPGCITPHPSASTVRVVSIRNYIEEFARALLSEQEELHFHCSRDLCSEDRIPRLLLLLLLLPPHGDNPFPEQRVVNVSDVVVLFYMA